MSSTTILLVRHAHADWCPDEMRPLSSVGRVEARTLCDRLAAERPRAIYSSPYRRALETVEPLSKRLGLTINVLEDLRERTLDLEPVEDWQAAIRPTWEDFSRAFPAGGETNAEALQRARGVVDLLTLRHPGDTIVVATHGNQLTLMLRVFDPSKGFDFWRQLATPDLYRWVIGPEGNRRLERLSLPS